MGAFGLAVVVGCGSKSRTGQSGSSGSSGVQLTTGASGTGAGPGGDTFKLDVTAGGSGGGVGEAGNMGCAKVDFLFVIDSSPSMQDEQANLLASFPGFISAIQDTLMFDDFHLMVVDASQPDGSGCDGTLGAGRLTDGNGKDCGIVGGNRYTTQAQPDLVAAFTCIGSRGFNGSPDEQAMDSLTAALGPLEAAGQCNEGFLRDDAVLVVTVITDEEDDPNDIPTVPYPDGTCSAVDTDQNSAGNPASWKDAVVQSKKGDPNAMVVLGLLGDCDTPNGMCPGIAVDPNDPTQVTGAEPAPRLRMFAESFMYGSWGPVCAPNYTSFFTDAVSEIAQACDNFVPPG